MSPRDEADQPIDDAEDEVLAPEVVEEGVGPQPRTTAGGTQDRRPLYALLSGFGSLFFLLLIPIPLIMLTLAIVGIYLGRRVMREIDPADGPSPERKRAKVGYMAGIMTLVLFTVLVVVLTLFYEPPDKDTGDIGDDKAATQPAEPGEG